MGGFCIVAIFFMLSVCEHGGLSIFHCRDLAPLLFVPVCFLWNAVVSSVLFRLSQCVIAHKEASGLWILLVS